jgi:hypothetical protein
MIVEWVPQSQYASDYITPPKPAKNYIPDWYKTLPPFHQGHTPTIESNRADSTEKQCMPLLDTFSFGYIQEAWCDISIRIDGQGKVVINSANMSETIVQVRPGRNRINPRDKNYYHSYEDHLNWMTHWEPKTPKGWSTYYSHPLNNYELPFRTIDGIIDTDRWWIGGSIPFLLKTGFEGVIPQGTPLYQMMFFKREDWKSNILKYEDIEKERLRLHSRVFNHFYGGYKKHMWVKKTYE